jgi:hypothetical protein
MRYFSYLLIVFSFSFLSSQAQLKIEDQLMEAEQLYDKGEFQSCIERCTIILTQNLSNVYNWQCYRLMAISYFQLNDFEESEKAVIQLLEINPFYELSSYKDPAGLKSLLKKHPPEVVANIRFLISPFLNYTLIRPIQSFALNGMTKSYFGTPTATFSLLFNYHLKRNLSLGVGLNIQNLMWNVEGENAILHYNEKQSLQMISLPVYAGWTFFKEKKNEVQLIAGLSLDMILANVGDYVVQTQNNSEQRFERVNLLDQRRPLNSSFILGLNSAWKLGSGRLCAGWMLSHGLQTINDPARRYRNQ